MATAAHTTVALLLAVRNGPTDPAWDLFVARYEPLLLAVARRLGLTADDAQDVVQQTLLEFVRDLSAGRFDRERGRMRTWLLSIARNRIRDALRRRGREPVGTGGDVARNLADPGSLQLRLEETWDRELERRLVIEAFDRLRASTGLSTETLRAFELSVIRGVPPETAASECGMSVDQLYVARSRVATRLRALVAQLREEWSDEHPATP